MKKLLNIISWSCFVMAAIAAVIAVICSVVGIMLLVSVVFGSSLLNLVLYCAIGYFGSLTVLTLIYVILCLYQAAKKGRKKV